MMLILRFLLLAFISLSCSAINTAQASFSAPNIADQLTLLSFKSRIRSDPSRALATWGNLSLPICQWHGVGCGLSGRRRGRVVVLDLAELNLLGTITPALGNLTYLRQLHLSGNRFHGILPPELGNLHDLETLQMNYNSIVGVIPPSLSNCSHLIEISVYGNKIHGGIPSGLFSLHNLESLILGENFLTGSISSNIGRLVNLKKLVLERNNMTGEIPTEIGSLANLNVLALGVNQFSGTIPTSLRNLSALTILTIPLNELEGSIPPLQSLSSLSVLELGANKLEGPIPSWLGNRSSLSYINLGQNTLVGRIPESLGNLEQLTHLDLSSNNLTGPVSHMLGNLSSLGYLDLQFNNLAGALPSDTGSKFSKLNYFAVSENQFHGVLPSSICNASTLQTLEAESNFLSGTIPRCLGSHQKNLSNVLLWGNLFEATNDADWGFMTSLTNSSNLRMLLLHANKFEGVLPSSIGNLSTLLEWFSIGDNNITGKITEGIGNLINLSLLHMDNNMLSDAIPASLSKLTNMEKLTLSNNAFSGPLPVGLGNLTKLTILVINNNRITGAIPVSLQNCPLELLDLSHNNLSGVIPKELFFISTLSRFLHLAHNSLSGTLPSEVGSLKNVAEFDFSSNKISGEIPTSIGECQSLEYLNTSGNLLQGTIPLSLGNLRGLLVLDLSHNIISGNIPEILGSLRGLSSLNLSFNKLQGGVPEEGIFLNVTAISITGNDGLCGGIPQLKLPPCSNRTTKRTSRKLTIVLAVSICSGLLFLALLFALSTFYKKRWKAISNVQRLDISEQYVRVSYAELASATNGFAFENLIGTGSFGSVYKGRMRVNSQHVVIAVKVLNLMQRGASQSFVAECETLRCARHRNLVKILTVCSSIDFQGHDFKALVYEFLPNGNLDQWLHQYIIEDGEQKALHLMARLCVAIDVASALDYLHQYKPVPIIHCDLKPNNVLLDSDMVAHVGDFGLARFLHQDTDKSSGWAAMRGSIGYAAPEYGLGNEVSIHGDVYSYGILLLEMFTGKRPTGSEFGEIIGLREYVQMALPDRVDVIADQQLLAEKEEGETGTSNSGSISRDVKIACITSILQVGICCCEETPMDRLPVGDALKELQGIRGEILKHLSSEGAMEHHHQAAEELKINNCSRDT